jgi:hypothetical protein
MKRNIIITILIGLILLTTYAIGQPVYPVSPRKQWTSIGSITSSGTTPAATARDYSTMIAMPATAMVHWRIPYDIDNLELRFQTTANAETNVIEMWAARGYYYDDGSTEDSFTLATIFTTVGGSQTGPNSNYFADTITVSSYLLPATPTITDSGNNRICRFNFNPCGYSDFIFLCTTIANAGTTTIYIDAAWFVKGNE